MGLDSVELVMAFEYEFGVSIPDAEAEKMATPRKVIDWLCSAQSRGELFTRPDSVPQSGMPNYTREKIAERVREIIREQTGVSNFSDDDRFIEDLRID